MKKRHINIQLLYTSKVIFSSLKKKKIIQKTNLLYHDMELLVFLAQNGKGFIYLLAFLANVIQINNMFL